MKIIFWNIKKLDNSIISKYFSSLEADIFLFCEDGAVKKNDIKDRIQGLGYTLVETPGCNRVSVFCKDKLTTELNIQNYFFTAMKISSDVEAPFYMVALHINSQMYKSIDELGYYISKLRAQIDANIGASLSTEIVIIGDFNVNPFETAMIGFNGFCATNSRKSRTHGKSIQETKELYINPTWELYSRKDYPGTKRYPRPSATAFDIIEWHYLDQVILSQKLNNSILIDKIAVIEKFSDIELLLEGSVKYSDHLPISYEFIRR